MMLTDEEVVEVYRRSLGRDPESDRRIERCREVYPDAFALTAGVRDSVEFRTRAEAALSRLLDATDGYQAVYAVPHLTKPHARSSEDRCRAIEDYVTGGLKAGRTGHLTVLDVGCAQGFSSLYFADRGADVVGIDHNPTNIDFCTSLAETAGIDARFVNASFGAEVIDAAIERGTNAVLLLSVLHHVIKEKGIAWVKAALDTLLEERAVLFCELARKGEPVPFDWREGLPEDELDIFPATANVVKIGEFDALNGLARRSLYAVSAGLLTYRPFTRRAEGGLPLLEPGPKTAIVRETRLSAVDSTAVRIKHYEFTDTLFAKTIRVTEDDRLELMRLVGSEALVSSLLGREAIGPELVGLAVRTASVALVFERIHGPSLAHYAETASPEQRSRIAIRIAEKLVEIHASGLSWNDCREHNILIRDDGEPVFIDFEFASFVPMEDDFVRARYLLYHLCFSESFAKQMESTGLLATHELTIPEADQSHRDWTIVDRILSTVARPRNAR